MTAESEPTPALNSGGDGDDATNSVRFADLPLPKPVLSALSADGYDTPSPIQAAIIPFLVEGRDVIGQAQTGTGKTAAFALPILTQLDAARQQAVEGEKQPKGPSALILAPTRELAIQVADAFTRYARKMKKIHVLAVYGGADFRGQAIPLQRGVDVVVGTPGRVMDHMRRGTLDVSNVKTLVLDEADEMLRMGFVEDVEWVLSETPAGRQVALFSATMPHEIKKIAERQLENPERIVIQGGSKTADTVRQRYWRVQGVRKVEALCRLLAVEPVDAAIVFVRTRAATSELARALEDAGFPAAALSGDIPQAQRERTIEALRKGRLKLVVATDVAARGIDVESISHVFNFDVPEDSEAYIHRIGRTGRAGRTGEAILFVENRQRRLLINIERATGKPIEKMLLPTEADVHALQLERFGEQLKERLTRKPSAEGDGEEAAPKPPKLRGFIDEICEATGRDAADVAAFLVGPAMASVLGGGRAPSVGTPSRASDKPSFDRSDRPAPRRPIGGSGEMYRVAVGRADGVRAGHLVGAIANETGLDGQDINKIRIFDSYSTLELPADMPANVFDRLQRLTVLGKPLRIKRANDRPSYDTPHAKRPHRPTPPSRKPFEKKEKTSSGQAKPSGKPSPTQASGKTTTKTKNGKPKFKAKAGGEAPAGPGKRFKKFKAAGPGKAKGKPSHKAKKGSGKPAKGDDVHSLKPAPFAGGKSKPVRQNKSLRRK